MSSQKQKQHNIQTIISQGN